MFMSGVMVLNVYFQSFVFMKTMIIYVIFYKIFLCILVRSGMCVLWMPG